jgi:hypothetical protein
VSYVDPATGRRYEVGPDGQSRWVDVAPPPGPTLVIPPVWTDPATGRRYQVGPDGQSHWIDQPPAALAGGSTPAPFTAPGQPPDPAVVVPTIPPGPPWQPASRAGAQSTESGSGHRVRNRILITIAVVIGGFFTIGVIGAVLHPSSTQVTTNHAAASTTASASRAASASLAPAVAARPSTPPPPRSAGTSVSSAAAASTLAPAVVRSKAAAILRADDAYYQAEFERGLAVVLARGTPNSFPAFSSWYAKAGTGDIQPGMTAFKQADAGFTADNEPPSISTWRDDNSTLSSDVAQLATDGLDVGGPADATARQKVKADAQHFPHDFAVAEKDAADVAAGK